MNKNEVATTNEQVVMDFSAFKAPEVEVVGLDINASDIKMPKVKLMQQNSQEAIKSKGKILAGQFYNTVTQSAKDSIDCIILDQGKSMVYWKKPFKRGEDPLCRSTDGKTKFDGCGDGDCSTCRFSSQNPAAWNNLGKDETKPPCNMSYVFLAIDCETGVPFRFIAGGASVKTAKDFLNKVKLLGVSPFACKITLTSKQEENDQGIFYIVDFENLRPNDDCLVGGKLDMAKYKELEDMSRAYKELFMTQMVQNDIVDVDITSDNDNNDESALF